MWRQRFDRMRFAFIFLNKISGISKIVLLWSGKTWRVQQRMEHRLSTSQFGLGSDRVSRVGFCQQVMVGYM